MEDWVTIKNLKAKTPDITNREIARQLGVSHNTVKLALDRGSRPEYNSEKRKSSLEAYRDEITRMANVNKFTGARIYNELCTLGYSGGKTAFYDFLLKIRHTQTKSFTPYETAPGEQAQFDWSPYSVVIGGNITNVYVYCYILSFSRYQILEVSLLQNQPSIFEALENSIIHAGGACSRLQTDNAKSFVINASKDNLQWNPRYINLCAHYGFKATRSIPGHPWSKGKVEKAFRYIEDQFIAGSSFESFPDMQRKIKIFQNEINKRQHSVTKTPPVELFEQEKLSLLRLPETKYVGIHEDSRKVSYDCLLSYNGSRYSVPWMFAGKFVWIKLSQGYYLEIYSQANKQIARHVLSLRKGSVIIEQSHFKNQKSLKTNFEVLKTKFLEDFPGYELFLEKLKAQRRTNVNSQLQQIICLSKLYIRQDFMLALDKSLEYNILNHSFISGYLEKNHRQSFKIEPVKITLDMPKENVKRDLSHYSLFAIGTARK